jgi:hypothetical protein
MTIDATVNEFFNVTDPLQGSGNYMKSSWLMQKVFCPESAGPPLIPSVGITGHGPNFKGATAVKLLFDTFFTSFPDISFAEYPNNNVRLYSKAGPTTVGLRAFLNGTFQQSWFQKLTGKQDKDSHYSKPLSDIHPGPAGGYNAIKGNGIAAAAVFIFNDANNPTLVSHLSIYLDRYRFISDLSLAADGTNTASAFDQEAVAAHEHGHHR